MPAASSAYAFDENAAHWTTGEGGVLHRGALVAGHRAGGTSTSTCRSSCSPRCRSPRIRPGSNPPRTLLDVIMVAITAYTPHPQEAWTVLKALNFDDPIWKVPDPKMGGLPTLPGRVRPRGGAALYRHRSTGSGGKERPGVAGAPGDHRDSAPYFRRREPGHDGRDDPPGSPRPRRRTSRRAARRLLRKTGYPRALDTVNRRRLHRTLTPYYFLMPAFAVLAVIILFPILSNVSMSAQKVRLLKGGGGEFVGLANYAKLLGSPTSRAAWAAPSGSPWSRCRWRLCSDWEWPWSSTRSASTARCSPGFS